MFYTASKVLWVLMQPSNLIVCVIAAGVLALLLGRGRVARCLLYPSTAALLLIGVLPVGELLLMPLENRFPAPSEPPGDIDGIVVLGGTVDLDVTAHRGVVTFEDTSERLTSLLELVLRYPEARVVFSGGQGWLKDTDLSEATAVRRFLRDHGIDEARVIFEDRARNTQENALFTKPLAAPQRGERWLLVTSASHMPRAVGCFRQVGWPVIAYPVDYRTTGQLTLRLPDAAKRWVEFDDAIRAWVGLIAYWMTDRIPDLLPAP